MAFLPFTHGGVQYPLVAATTNRLLEDADPSLDSVLTHVGDAIIHYVGTRLLAQAALEGLNFTSAVAQRIHVEPVPLLADQLIFPTLAIFRKADAFSGSTMSWDRDAGEWECAYVLPPLTPRQRQNMESILRVVSVVMRRAITTWVPPGGVERARVTSVKYGGYEPVQEIPNYYRAVFGTIEVVERDLADVRGREPFAGANVNLDHLQHDKTVLSDVVTFSTYQPPTIASVSPSSGTKAGGTTVTVTGAGFRVGTPVRIAIGDVECTNAVVLSTTQVRGVTGAHAAYPTFIADVVVTNADDQAGRKAAAFSYTTP